MAVARSRFCAHTPSAWCHAPVWMLLLCSGLLVSTGSAMAASLQPVEISFEARAGDQRLECGRVHGGIGSTKANVSLQDFRIYVSNVRLIRQDGVEVGLGLDSDGTWQNKDVALLDFENATGDCNGTAATNSTVRGVVPAGAYTGLVFEIGVPVQVNHQDTSIAAPPLNLSALTWPWRWGYKFTTIDLETSGGTAPANRPDAASGFSIHLGSIDCGEGAPSSPPEVPCKTSNRPSYRLERFNADREVVILDLAALLAETDVTRNHPESASGCMAGPPDDDCVHIMDRFGLPFRGKASAGQKFVRTSVKP